MASGIYPNPNDTKAPPPYEFSNAPNSGPQYPHPNPVYSPNFGTLRIFEWIWFIFLFICIVPAPPPVYIQSTLNPIIGSPYLGQNPTPIQCPRCQQQVITVVQYEAGAGTWLIALGICFFGGFIGCCLIPFCLPMCQDSVHICPSCKNIIGRRNLI